MVPGSRFIPALLGEIQINAIGQMQSAKKEAHNAVGISGWFGPIGNAERETGAAAENERPTKDSHAARHKKARAVESATVKDHPAQGQPKHADHGAEVVRR